MLNEISLLIALSVGQTVDLPDRVYVPRTEIRSKTILVPQTIFEEVKVYEPYRVLLVPENQTSPVRLRFKSKTRWGFRR